VKVGDLTTFGTILEIKDNPPDVSSGWYIPARKIALMLPLDGGCERWAFVATLRGRERTQKQIEKDRKARSK
jgi:hypothetical protein